MSSLDVRRRARVLELGDAEAPQVWILLHGYGQLAGAFLDSCRALARPERRLVAPEALSRFYLRGGAGAVGASWMTREAREDEIGDYVAYLDRVAEHGAARRGAECELHVLAFSQGVATAWRWMSGARRAPRRLIAVGGGIPPDLVLEAPRLRSLEVLLIAGQNDGVYPPQQARVDAERVAGRAERCEVLVHAGGHELPAELLAAL